MKLIYNINPSYKMCVLTNKTIGKKSLYEKLTKAVYKTLLGALLYYLKLSGQLEEWGYNQNTYDPCSFNKTVITNSSTGNEHPGKIDKTVQNRSFFDQIG